MKWTQPAVVLVVKVSPKYLNVLMNMIDGNEITEVE
jgi:hypothetical protein